MKNFKNYLPLAGLAIVLSLAGCSGTKQKSTEIPITTTSAEAKASLQQGIEALYLNDLQQARTLFVKAISQDPKLSLAYVYKAFTNESPKEFADDINNANANLEGVSDYEKFYAQMGSTYLTNDWNKRLDIVQQLVAKYPDVAAAQVDLGVTYDNGNQFDKARACYQKAADMSPKWAGAYAALVNCYIFDEPKDFKKAEANALKEVELAPTSSGAEIALGDCYRAQNSLEKARDAYAKAITLNPNVSEAYYKEGHANTFLGNYDEARKNYAEGAKYDDNKFNASQFISNTYLYSGDYKAALTYLDGQLASVDASGYAPSKIAAAKMNLLDNCATISMHNNDVAKLKEAVTAMEPLSAQMGTDMGTDEAKLGEKATMLYWQSMTAALDGNYDAAKSKAEEMKTTLDPVKDPNKLNGYEFAMGFIDMKQKNYPDAVNHFGKTQQNITYNKYWFAMANMAAGNKDKASSLLKEVTGYNFNETGFALVRNEAKTTLASL